jgi:hypothetical protein
MLAIILHPNAGTNRLAVAEDVVHAGVKRFLIFFTPHPSPLLI